MQVVSSGGGPKTLAGVVHSAILGAGGAWLLPCLHPVVPTEFSITAGFWWPKQTSSRGAAGAGSSHSGQQATKGDDTLTVTSWALWGGPDVALPKRHLVAPESQGKLLRKGLGGWERLGEAVFSHPDLPSKVRSRKVMARERSWDKIVFIFAESDISRTYLTSGGKNVLISNLQTTLQHPWRMFFVFPFQAFIHPCLLPTLGAVGFATEMCLRLCGDPGRHGPWSSLTPWPSDWNTRPNSNETHS